MEKKNEMTNVNENVNVNAAAAEASVIEETILASDETMFGTLSRKQNKGSDGKLYWNYFQKNTIRNREVTISFVPKDVGGYGLLEIVYGDGSLPVDIIHNKVSSTDNKGNKLIYDVFFARQTDENGCIYECKIKPKEESDKNMINTILYNRRIMEGKK